MLLIGSVCGVQLLFSLLSSSCSVLFSFSCLSFFSFLFFFVLFCWIVVFKSLLFRADLTQSMSVPFRLEMTLGPQFSNFILSCCVARGQGGDVA